MMESAFDPSKIQDNLDVKAFLEFREHGRIPLKYALPLGLKALLTDIPFALLKYWPGAVGMQLRQFYYKWKFGFLGKNALIGHAAEISQPQNIFATDYVFIDHHVTLD
ncbi:MAG: hypothetical protein ACXVBQ_14510, partial [Pseudobdellovibrionaceae bacterium]